MSELLKTPLRQVQSVQHLLMNEQARNQLAMVATKALTPERMMRVVANAIRRTPALQECEPMSFLGAMMFCAQMGLEPQSPLGLAYLVPFNKSMRTGQKDAKGKDIWAKIKTVEVVIGYKGFKELARRSGEIKSMHGDIVYAGDEFSHEYGSHQHLKHIPCGSTETPLGAYFHVAFQGGEGHVYMTRAEIEAHRDRYSKGWQDAVKNGKTEDSPWKKDWEAMWIKTPCRRLMSRGDIPMSVEMMDALAADEEPVDFSGFAFDPRNGPVIDAEKGGDHQAEDLQMIEHGETMRADFDRKPEHRDTAPAQRQQQEKPAQRRDTGAYAEGAPKLTETRQEEPEQGQGNMFAESEQESKPAANAGLSTARFAENTWGQTFLKDVADVGFDQAYGLHDVGFDQIRDERPDFFEWLKVEILKIDDTATF